MSVKISGLDSLLARFEAIKPSPEMMHTLALAATAEQKRLVPRKTGNLGRSIGIGAVTPISAETVAGARYAAPVEFGTRAHVIRPRNAKALRWGTGKVRLSGAPAKGSSVQFARKVNHPGTRAQPFMVPGARRALDLLGISTIVGRWNKAGG